ncbi:hypothetical protein AWV79_13295 [Cupriavidus sp. UYMMa02A]|nr:hypothetical protein AWV79_13295 [Cupriavidus sp. UYMMa02A]
MRLGKVADGQNTSGPQHILVAQRTEGWFGNAELGLHDLVGRSDFPAHAIGPASLKVVGDSQLNAVTFFVRQTPAPRQRGTLPALGGLPEITDDIGQLHHGLSLLSIWNSLLRLSDPEVAQSMTGHPHHKMYIYK